MKKKGLIKFALVVAMLGSSSQVSYGQINLLSEGARCDGITDDTNAIKHAYSLLSGKIAGQIVWPSRRTCVVSDTIALRNAQSINIDGGQLEWRGNASNPIFQYSSDRNVLTRGFYISPASPSSFPIGTAFAIREDNEPGFGISSGNVFIDNVIEGISLGGLNIGFEQVEGSAGNANNDQMRFYGNEVRNYAIAGWQIDHNQATDDLFSGNQCYANRIGEECVNNTTGAGFTWEGGFVGGNKSADFLTSSDSSHPITISGVASEGSNRFVIVVGPTASPAPVTLLNDRFSTDALDADDHMVLYNAPGPLNVIGGSYGQGNEPGNFYFNPSQARYHEIFGQISGVTASGKSSSGVSLLEYAPGITKVSVTVYSNVYIDASGHATH